MIDPYASNLGHTFGHALEKISNYKVLHGDAINVGTVMALYFSVYEGLIKESLANEIMGIMKNLSLNLYIDRSMDIPSFVQLMKKDKKSMSGILNLVLIKSIGNTYEDNGHRFYKTETIKVEKFLMDFIKNYKYSVNDFPSCINKEIIQY
jgi:3-dehydroquinate synthetase